MGALAVAAASQVAGVIGADAQGVANTQLRNAGTLGGNLCQKPRCWYYRGEFHCLRKGGDTCYGIGGDSRYHAIFGGNGCCMVHPSDTAAALVALDASVRIAGSGGSRTVKVADFHVPPALQMDGDRAGRAGIVLSGVAPVPWRVEAAERALAGRRLDAAVIAAAADAAVAGAEPLDRNTYKVPLVRGMLQEELEAIRG